MELSLIYQNMVSLPSSMSSHRYPCSTAVVILPCHCLICLSHWTLSLRGYALLISAFPEVCFMPAECLLMNIWRNGYQSLIGKVFSLCWKHVASLSDDTDVCACMPTYTPPLGIFPFISILFSLHWCLNCKFFNSSEDRVLYRKRV